MNKDGIIYDIDLFRDEVITELEEQGLNDSHFAGYSGLLGLMFESDAKCVNICHEQENTTTQSTS